MKLADWLYRESMTPSQLRRMLGVADRATVWRHLTGKRKPKPETIAKIEVLTCGEVTEEDFLDRRPPKCARIERTADGKERIRLPWSKGWVPPAGLPPVPDTPHARLSVPVKQALLVLEGRASYTRRGRFLLDGRIVDLKRIIQEANTILKARGHAPIAYPNMTTPGGKA